MLHASPSSPHSLKEIRLILVLPLNIAPEKDYIPGALLKANIIW